MKVLFLILITFFGFTLYAKQDVVVERKQGGQIAGSVVEIQSGRYATSKNTDPINRNYFVGNAYGLVKLSFPSTGKSRPAGEAKVSVSIEYEEEQGGVFYLKKTRSLLKLNLSNSQLSDVAYVKLENAQRLKVEVLSAGTSIPSGWEQLSLEASITTESYDLLEKGAIDNGTLGLSSSLTEDGNLKVSWNAIAAAEHYQLEWTYVSDQNANDPAKRLSPNEINIDRFLFRNNSSRVEVKDQNYDIPMIYEKGIIIYRVRGIGKNIVNGILIDATTDWTSPDGAFGKVSEFPTSHYFIYNGHEQNLNWQSSLSFAEEGKNKVVISYHDGSARNRQSVTRINTDKRAVLGESLYDYNGRPIVQLLPVPVKDNSITFYPHFNLVEETNTFQKKDFDIAFEGKGCLIATPAFDTKTGASKYYSPENDFGSNGNTGANIINKELIPDAEKYPYTQTRYTPDNTGRIAAQSGVGLTHRLGTKRETKYFYAVPQQPEISRLFGNQVGYNTHYKKNTVVDPNGQTSISYLDLDGKVIATALAGPKPANVEALDGTKSRTISTDLLSSGRINNLRSADRLSNIYSSKFTVSSTTNYSFTYNAQVEKYDLTCSREQSGNPLKYSLDGAVNVELLLKDGCGIPIFRLVGITEGGKTGSLGAVKLEQQKNLEPGEYHLAKTLTINEEKLEEYWQDYLSKEGVCVLKEKDFVEEELAQINTAGCGLTCEDCEKEVKKILNSSTVLSSEERAQLAKVCDQVCKERPVTCRSAVEPMRGDLSPGGQYAQLRKEKVNLTGYYDVAFDENNNPIETRPDIKLDKVQDGGDPLDNVIDPSGFPLSIFYDFNRLPVPGFLRAIEIERASWRKPVQIAKAGYGVFKFNEILDNDEIVLENLSYSITDYKDRKTGDVFYVDVFKIFSDDGNSFYYKPEVIEGARLIEVDAETGMFKVPVRDLKHLADFEKYWQTHWANYLIPYHPEYGYLLDCSKEIESEVFDYNLIQSDLQKAISLGYIDGNGNPQIIGSTQSASIDPYLKKYSGFYDYISKLDREYKNFEFGGNTSLRSMAQMATILSSCPRGDVNCGYPNCEDGKIDTDIEWNTYKSLYLKEKQLVVRDKSNRTAVKNLYYNGCIGHKDYLTAPNAHYFNQPTFNQVPYTYTYTHCWKEWYNHLRWFNKCTDFTREYFNVIKTYPYQNPGQVCYRRRAGEFEKKSPRFNPYLSSATPAGQMPENCFITYKEDDDPLKDPIRVKIPCDEDVKEAMEQTIVDANRFKFESCGQCPLASEVELFLMDLKRNRLLNTSEKILVTCELDEYPVKIGEVLRRELLLKSGGQKQLFWSSTLSNNNKVLNGNFSDGVATLATITLEIPESSIIDFMNLEKICCLSVPTDVIGMDVKTFTMKASNVTSSEEIYVRGSFSLSLFPCQIPPRCLITDDATNLGLFLNILAANIGKENHLNTQNKNILLDAENLKPFYNEAILSLIKKDREDVYNGYIPDIAVLSPAWKSYISGNVLTGILSYTLEGSRREILIEISGLVEAQYLQVGEFIRIRPEKINMESNDQCLSQSCVKTTLIADANIVNLNERKPEKVTINVPGLKPIMCKPATAPKRLERQ